MVLKLKIVFINVKLTLNNMFITFKNSKNVTILKGSPGILGFKGSKRLTRYAIQTSIIIFSKKINILGYKYAIIFIKNFNNLNLYFLKDFKLTNINIVKIIDKTNEIFNGCRISKKRRL